jgi:hypothetical protein
MEPHGRIIEFRICRICMNILLAESGPLCEDGHLLTCCGGKSPLHEVLCPKNAFAIKMMRAGEALAIKKEKELISRLRSDLTSK